MRLGITGEIAFSKSGTMVNLEGTGTQDLRFVRIDRAGRRAPVDTDWRGSFNSFALSPDGKQLAISVMQGGHTDLWVKQLDRGPLTRLTFEGAVNYRAAWVPGGSSVGFLSDRTGRTLPYVVRADGSSPATRFAVPDTGQVDEIQWTRDGQWVVYRTGVVAGVRRISRYKVGDSVSVPIEEGRFDQYMPTVSPDGRWLAYVTVESGREEVYVRPFPNTAEARWQVSSAGGSTPVWSPSGKALYFVTAANQLVSVPIGAGPTFQAGTPVALFSIEGLVLPPYHQALAVTPDDQGFYFLEDQGGTGAELRYAIVTLNWLDQLTSPAGKKDK
jgi:Tol biopolymer transport system component